MILIKNYKQYLSDKNLDLEFIEENILDNNEDIDSRRAKRLFEELKQQLNEVDKYQLKIKALNDTIDTLRTINKWETEENKNLKKELNKITLGGEDIR